MAHIQGITMCLLALIASSTFIQDSNNVPIRDELCLAPGICEPPVTQHFSILDATPRKQWTISGGFCGAMSIQTLTMAKGAYISQDFIRKNAVDGGSHNGNAELGYEILPANLPGALTNMSITFEMWDHDNQPQPQSTNYLKWTKYHLSNGNGIVSFLMCKGDSHNAYGLGAYDHIEPIFGIYSTHPLEDIPLNETQLYDDDWIQHASNYAPDGNEDNGYFRLIKNFTDDKKMQGNCKDAQSGVGKNEMYPCLYYNDNYGAAITGLVDPLNLTKPLAIMFESFYEPNIRDEEDPIDLTAYIKITDLEPFAQYTVYRYDNIPGKLKTDYPQNSEFDKSQYTTKYEFTAGDEPIYRYIDEQPINSHSMVYYACVQSKEAKDMKNSFLEQIYE